MSTQPCTVCRAGLCFVGVRGEPGKADRTFLATLRAVICQNPFIEILNAPYARRQHETCDEYNHSLLSDLGAVFFYRL